MDLDVDTEAKEPDGKDKDGKDDKDDPDKDNGGHAQGCHHCRAPAGASELSSLWASICSPYEVG